METVLEREFCGDVFGLFRSWYNRRALDPDGPWHRLTLVFAYAAEGRQMDANPNQSPFNVGVRIALEDLTVEQVQQLNLLHQSPLRNSSEVSQFYRLVGGHPYLVRQGLAEMVRRDILLGELERRMLDSESVFGSHLREIRAIVEQDERLTGALRDVLRRVPCDAPDEFSTLRTMGVLADGDVPRVRYDLYRRYLEACMI